MTLSFKQQINGQPTYFIEKFWESILPDPELSYMQYQQAYLSQFNKYWDGTGDCWHDPVNPKHHTIRADPKDRWQAGKLIHPVVNNRTANRFQFAPAMKCISVQSIEIKIHNGNALQFATIKIDGHYTGPDVWQKVAINDGFNSTDDFFKYFNKDFTGKIIHWTNLKY